MNVQKICELKHRKRRPGRKTLLPVGIIKKKLHGVQ